MATMPLLVEVVLLGSYWFVCSVLVVSLIVSFTHSPPADFTPLWFRQPLPGESRWRWYLSCFGRSLIWPVFIIYIAYSALALVPPTIRHLREPVVEEENGGEGS